MTVDVVERLLVKAADAVGLRFTAVDLRTAVVDGRLALRDPVVSAKAEFVDDRFPRAFAAEQRMRRAVGPLMDAPMLLRIRLDDHPSVQVRFEADAFAIGLIRGALFQVDTGMRLDKAVRQVLADELQRALLP